jgi:hypothetical protein
MSRNSAGSLTAKVDTAVFGIYHLDGDPLWFSTVFPEKFWDIP